MRRVMRSRGLTRWPGEGVSARKDQNLGQSLEEFQFVRAGGAAGGGGARERRKGPQSRGSGSSGSLTSV